MVALLVTDAEVRPYSEEGCREAEVLLSSGGGDVFLMEAVREEGREDEGVWATEEARGTE